MPIRIHVWLSFFAALSMLASCAGEANPQNSLFQPAVRIAVQSKPSNVAVADLNKDGRLDLIVASEEARTVSVMLGEKGEVPFRAVSTQTITLMESPGEMAVGDVNGDGQLDLALDHHDSYNVTLLFGNGRGGFAPAPTSPVVMKQGQHPHTHGLGMGDFNADGKLDLATVNNEDNDISVALGDGRGGFTNAPGSPFAVGPSPYPLTLGDVNGDGRLDIVANTSATGPNRAQQLATSRALTVLINDGTGGFRRSDIPLRTGQPWFAAIGDLNSDARADLVATHHDQNQLTVILNEGSGRFRESPISPFNLGRNAWRIDLADINGDKRLDVIAAIGEGVHVMLVAGAGNFEPAPNLPFATARGTWRLVVGDLNHDSKPDIVTSNTDSNSVTVLFGK